MRKEYEEELARLKEKMEKAEAFAEKFPFLEEDIIDSKWSGEESHICLTNRYKNLYLSWGLYRTFYTYESSKQNISNYKGEAYQGYLNHVYLNSLSLYNCHENFGLEDICNKVPVFFYDNLNTTFYVQDEHLGKFLDLLNDWYLAAREQAIIYTKEQKKRELEKQLAELTTPAHSG